MKFYEILSENYDDIFPMKTKTLDFISTRISGKRVVDLGCGTGNYTIALSKEGFDTIGIDLDNEMINKARTKSKDLNNKPRFIVGDMLEVDNIVSDKVDFIFSIGNSIVHLENEEQILKLFKNSYNSLNENGKLLIQIVNYNRVINKDIKSLPTIKVPEKNLFFERKYELDNGKIKFNTSILKDEDRIINSIDLIPLTKERMEYLLKLAGFKELNYFGSFEGDKLTEDSFHTIVIANK